MEDRPEQIPREAHNKPHLMEEEGEYFPDVPYDNAPIARRGNVWLHSVTLEVDTERQSSGGDSVGRS